jgi:hypothetical protein
MFRRFGMITCIAGFIPNMSGVTQRLRVLLNEHVEWQGENQERNAFDEVKQLLCVSPVLAYYMLRNHSIFL